MRLNTILAEVLLEMIDLYQLDELKSKGVEYVIKRETSKVMQVFLTYKGKEYEIYFSNVLDPEYHNVSFGNIEDVDGHRVTNVTKLLNDPSSKVIVPTVFGFLKYYVDKYDVKGIEYDLHGSTRDKIYNYYINKYFTGYERSEENVPDEDGLKLIRWKKK